MNHNYATKVKEEIEKLLHVGFIRPVERATWLSPIVVVPKKNGKICVCVDYRKLNATTVTNGFPLPFTNSVLDTVASHECYKFLDGFSGYNQIRMHPDDQEKTAFVTEWGGFVAQVMMFGLKKAAEADADTEEPEGSRNVGLEGVNECRRKLDKEHKQGVKTPRGGGSKNRRDADIRRTSS